MLCRTLLLFYEQTNRSAQIAAIRSRVMNAAQVCITETGKNDDMEYRFPVCALELLRSGDKDMALALVGTFLKVNPLETLPPDELGGIAVVQREAGDESGYTRTILLLEAKELRACLRSSINRV